MDLLFTLLVVIIGVPYLVIRWFFSEKPQKPNFNTLPPLREDVAKENEAKANEDKPYVVEVLTEEEKKKLKRQLFWTSYGPIIVVLSFCVLMGIGFATESLIILGFCLAVLVLALLCLIFIGFVDPGMDKLIKREVDKTYPNEEQRQDIIARYQVKPEDQFTITRIWREEEYNRRKSK